MFIDTHCHLYKEYYENLDSVIEDVMNNNVSLCINNGTDNKTNIEVLETSNKYNAVYAALGIHPENVLSYQEEDIDFIEQNINNPKVLAIGEIGLDYHYGLDNKKEQIKLFTKQIDLASKYNKPVIIHSRDADLDMLSILSKYKLKGIIHSFSGDIDTANKYIELGYILGINGIITFKNSSLKDVIKSIPLNKIVLETDSPYLSPEPFRGHINSPKNVIEVAKYISNLKGISLEELSKITNSNIKELFNI